jgi:hypothetical protein
MTGMLYVEVRTSSREKQYSIMIAIEYPITKYKPIEMIVAFGTTREASLTSSAATIHEPFASNT